MLNKTDTYQIKCFLRVLGILSSYMVKSKILKRQIIKGSLRARKSNDLNSMAQFDKGHLHLRKDDLRFSHNCK
jgi:hypothetical protein